MPGDDPPTASAAVVLLLGYPAAGKRTVGGHVARLLDGVLVDNQLIFPDDDTLSKTFDFMALDENQIKQYEGDWSDVTGG